ncbi:hypothetical protein LCGC14_1533220 [marine sediment metagenome]|uniref:Uncharacterized protein n=1 Tax=marine sediment metagenome TaxID=412755 RepID=A0A0F9LW64_9ZZZZ
MKWHRRKKLERFPHDGIERRISTETSHRLMRAMLDQNRVAVAKPRWPIVVVVGAVAVFVVVGILVGVMR